MTMSDGARELWQEMQADGMPHVEVLRESTHRARKTRYRCSACHDMIRKGARYHYTVLKEDGEFVTSACHVWCP